MLSPKNNITLLLLFFSLGCGSFAVAQKAGLREKLSPALQNSTTKVQRGAILYTISGPDLPALVALLKRQYPSIPIIRTDSYSRSAVIRTTFKILQEALLPRNEISFADIYLQPHAEVSIIGYNRSFHGISAVDYSIAGATGKNITVGIKEQRMEEADLDVHQRVLFSPLAAPTVTNHATVIASIIGGSGNSFYDGRGIAHGCTFFPSNFDNLFADDAAILNAAHASVQNHSYGTVVQQFYGAEALSYDAQTWQHKDIIHVFSAGNRGIAAAAEGPYANITGYANLTGNFKMAKNIITVGAIDNKENISIESSAGPLYDGRIAPQLTALGPNGTSDAAAMVSGAAAVLQQVYKDSNNQQLPPAALVKCILYNTADDIYNKNIDYKTGYGLLNSYAAVKTILQKRYDGSILNTNGQSWTKNITVPANAAKLKVTLAWTDSAAALNNNKALLHDLDLQVTATGSGTVYQPWCLSTAAHADSLVKLPVRKRDSLNTAEQVSIELPAAGNYEIRVTKMSAGSTPIAFHIAFLIDTLNTFEFTSPQHTSDVNRQEDPQTFVRWKSFTASSNETGDLAISYNGGASWQMLQGGITLAAQKYMWAVKDTASKALLRMTTSFGSYLSKPFYISQVTRPEVDFFCADSFRLSWHKHVDAAGYRIYTLTDSPYLKPVISLSDTFIVINRNAYPGTVYAVEPVTTTGIPASRSIAIDVSLQGVSCFYKTFYYTLQDENVLDLVLELSSTVYIDSIFFERVDQQGQLLQRHGAQQVNTNNSIYHQLVNDPPRGSSYWRARIKLKNGTIIYTNIIDVLTSGKQYILFYPNPVSRKGSLQYIQRQGLPPGSRLQLLDMSGRLLKNYPFVPDRIDLATFPAGMIMYRLTSPSGQVLETGKLILL